MNRYTVIGVVVGFLLGLFVGVNISSGASPRPAPVAMQGSPQMPAMPPPQGGAPAPGAPSPDLVNRIGMNQSIVARDPKNRAAWVQLGNDYFDTHQPQKAIEAYDRALELKPNDPDVLTDQGVMYRTLGQFDKAIQNFEQASKADPKHVQSLFNMGVVYSSDLKQPKKAIDAWTRVIQLAPQSEQANNARSGIEELKGQATK